MWMQKSIGAIAIVCAVMSSAVHADDKATLHQQNRKKPRQPYAQDVTPLLESDDDSQLTEGVNQAVEILQKTVKPKPKAGGVKGIGGMARRPAFSPINTTIRQKQ